MTKNERLITVDGREIVISKLGTDEEETIISSFVYEDIKVHICKVLVEHIIEYYVQDYRWEPLSSNTKGE